MAASPAVTVERPGWYLRGRPFARRCRDPGGVRLSPRLVARMRPAPARGNAMKKALLAMMCAAVGAASAEADQAVVLEGARLIDGTGKAPRENSVIVVQGDRIAAVGTVGKVKYPKGARVVDVRGRTIIPGLINAHGHVGLVAGGKNSADAYTRENVQAQLAQYEQYGVTAVLTLGLNRDLVYEVRDEQRRGALGGASLFTAGRGIGVPDGAPPVPVAPDQVYRPKTVEEAIADVRETAGHHPDFLKLWV